MEKAAASAAAAAPEPVCDNAGCEQPSTKRCGRCQSKRYCSRACQKAHWDDHQEQCGVVKKIINDAGKRPASSIKNRQTYLDVIAALAPVKHRTIKVSFTT